MALTRLGVRFGLACNNSATVPATTGAAIDVQGGVLDVDVVDAVAQLIDKAGGVHHLPVQVAWVEVDSECRPVCKESSSSRANVSCATDDVA